ncbi:MAG: metalloprotease [Maribacter sp.]|nr:metalloprotease [Maribacter sp.]
MKQILYTYCFILIFPVLTGGQKLFAQHKNTLTVKLNGETKELNIQQEFVFNNTSKYPLDVLYFNDWAHAYSNKNTGLAERFAEEFKKGLHLAKEQERGRTNIISVVDEEYRGLNYERTSEKEIVRIDLSKTLLPGKSIQLFITYTIKLPPDKYTSYGYNNRNEYYLKDWYLSPAVFDGKWHLYSNKDLEDLYTGITRTTVNFTYPADLYLTTNYRNLGNSQFSGGQQAQLEAIQQKNCVILLSPFKKFSTHVTPYMTMVTDIDAFKYDKIAQGISINKIAKFIYDNLGKYPHSQLLVSKKDYDKNPLYGINQLPSFIRPYEEQFQFEMKFLKTALYKFLEETIFLDPRKEQWLQDAIANYLMIAYVEEFYPNQKLLGKLSKLPGVRGFNLAKMDFNEQYLFLYMLTARKNLNQALRTPNDSLIKFNQKIANKYKAGLGLAYLANYLGKDKVDQSIKTYYKHYSLNSAKVIDFESILKRSTDIDIDWFFNDYLSTDKKIDFKIKHIEKLDDSLRVTIKNKAGTNVPISLFGIKKDSIVSKYWFSNISTEKTFTIAKGQEDKLVLNYDQIIPEFNQRDNWKSLKGFFSSNKKLQFRFFQDAENPYYNQVFYVPVLGFNVYDGWTPGLRIHNTTFLEKPFLYSFAPSYALREKSFVGFGSITVRNYLKKSGLYVVNYGLRGSTSHYQVNSRYSTFTPSIRFGWRPDNLRSNKRDILWLRYVNVFRDQNPDLVNIETDPDYSVLNARYTHSNNGIIDYFSWFADAQYSGDFSKLSFELEYRKLFENNKQFNFRFFAGKFLTNNIDPNITFFDFALDRPNDYLFDYNYLGRSEETGIFSQQIIIAEGGFKSKLPNPFSNDWIVTTNSSINIWRWIEFYGDFGFIKRKGQKERLVYDSGIRLNLVTDYFELYFPLYSNNGWEISQPRYEEKIRFVITLSPRTLTGLFTRKWF